MGLPEYERTNIRYANSHPSNTPSLHTQSSANVTRPFLNLYDSQNIDSRKHRSGGVSNSKNSESSDTQEPDLELRLSL
ncbi:protein SPEAR3-like [Senna tora]|uniref:Protein SPEAR3-like n=1 Tax=Senna tora TaxID=362788 RepID=A0A834TEI1_9FABA|nr:protein SPEAR3-like [Senna tora]